MLDTLTTNRQTQANIGTKTKEANMATLEEIRAKLAEQEKKTTGGSSVSDNAIFPFWNIPEGTTSTLRFLPDANKDNTFFWVERAMIKLPFPGIKGQAEESRKSREEPRIIRKCVHS